MYIYIYIYIYAYPCPCPPQVPQTSSCTHLLSESVLQTLLGMGMGMNVAAQLPVAVNRSTPGERGSAPKGGRHSTVVFESSAKTLLASCIGSLMV